MTDDSFDSIHSAITTAADGSIVTRWCVVAETINADGEQQIEQFYPEGGTLWDQIGLLSFALEDRKARISTEDDDQ